MTDKPAAAPVVPAAEEEARPDPTLRSRKIIAWVVSALLAGTTVALGIKFFLRTELNATVPISFVEVPLLPLAAFPMTIFFVLWIDKLMRAGIVSD